MQVAVIGLGRFGSSLAINLSMLDADVIAIDTDMERVEEIQDKVTDAVCISGTDEKSLLSTGIMDCDTVVVAIGEDMMQGILTTAILRRMGALNIISRATNTIQAEILKEIGAVRVIYIEEQIAEIEAERIMSEKSLYHTNLPGGYSLVEVTPFDEIKGLSLKEIDFTEQYNVKLVALKTKTRKIDKSGAIDIQENINPFPQPEEIIGEDDTLLIFGKDKDIRKFVE